jgi:hypothetical protein
VGAPSATRSGAGRHHPAPASDAAGCAPSR